MAAPHDTGNYTIGKGILSLQKTGESTFTDLGNAPTVDFTIETESLDHYSSREGIKTLDLRVPISRKATLKIVLDEIAPENLTLALYGTSSTSTGATPVTTIDGFKAKAVTGSLKLVGSNDIGRKFEWLWANTTITPSGTLSLIGDGWMEIELEASVGADATGKFFTVKEL